MERYPESVIRQASDATYAGSVQKRFPDWPPNIGQITQALDDEAARQARLAKDAGVKREKFRPEWARNWFPGCFAQVHIHPDAVQYEHLRAAIQDKHLDEKDWKWVDGGWDDGGGLWVSLSALGGLPMARFGPKPIVDYAAGLDEKYRKPAEEIAAP
jgi:hypothetical protein